MVKVAGGPYRFVVKGIEIEGSGTNIQNNPFGVDFQYVSRSRLYPVFATGYRFHDHN